MRNHKAMMQCERLFVGYYAHGLHLNLMRKNACYSSLLSLVALFVLASHRLCAYCLRSGK